MKIYIIYKYNFKKDIIKILGFSKSKNAALSILNSISQNSKHPYVMESKGISSYLKGAHDIYAIRKMKKIEKCLFNKTKS